MNEKRLNGIIIRIDLLSANKDIITNGVMNAEIYKEIYKIFPQVKEEFILNTQLAIGNPGANIPLPTNKPNNLKKWTFKDPNRLNSIAFETNAIILDLQNPQFPEVDIDLLIQKFFKIVELNCEIEKQCDVKRFGVRFIYNSPNETLESSGTSFKSELINDILFFDEDSKDMIQSMNVYDFNFGSCQMKFVHGYLNTNFPSKTGRFTYVLDFDIYTTNIIEKYTDLYARYCTFIEKIEFYANKSLV